MFILIDYDIGKDRGIIKSDFLSNIREHFSVEDDKANLKKHIFRKFGKGRFIPTRRYVITEAGRFDLGLLVEILKYLKSLNTPFKIVFSEEFKKRYHCNYDFANQPLIPLIFPYRDYQAESIQKGLTNGNGIILSPTGSGKTLIMAGLISNIRNHLPKTKTLVITPTHLINQTYDEFVSYGISPAMLSKWSGDNDLNPNAEIVISGNNIVTSKIENTALKLKKAKVILLSYKKELDTNFDLSPEKRKEIQKDIDDIEKDIPKIMRRDNFNKHIHDYFETVDLLLVDEVHQYKKGNEITEITQFIHTRHTFGFTGTTPSDPIDQWTIIGKIGPVVYEVPRDKLVEEKHITDTDIQILDLVYNDEPDFIDMGEKDDDVDDERPTARYQAELDFIQTNAFRNNVIKKITNKLKKNILIVLDRLPHGEHLLEFLTKQLPDKKVYFIQGKVETEDREKITKLMESENNMICIAISKIFSTGINIKNIHYIIFASAGKAKVKTIQTIGRGVRTLDGKTKVVIFDLADRLTYGKRHLQKRKQLYEEEGLKYKVTEIREN